MTARASAAAAPYVSPPLHRNVVVHLPGRADHGRRRKTRAPCPAPSSSPRQGQTRFGEPVRIHPLGVTEIEAPLFEAYLAGLADTFGPGKYHLLERNCNNFSNEVSEFLVGHGIPSEIVSMPQDLLSTYGGAGVDKRPRPRPRPGPAAAHRASRLVARLPAPAGPSAS